MQFQYLRTARVFHRQLPHQLIEFQGGVHVHEHGVIAHFVPVHRLSPAAALDAQTRPRAIDQQMAHGARRVGEEGPSVGKLEILTFNHAHIQLMHQCGGVEGVIGGDLGLGDAAKILVQMAEQGVGVVRDSAAHAGLHFAVSLHAIVEHSLTFQRPNIDMRAFQAAQVIGVQRFRHA